MMLIFSLNSLMVLIFFLSALSKTSIFLIFSFSGILYLSICFLFISLISSLSLLICYYFSSPLILANSFNPYIGDECITDKALTRAFFLSFLLYKSSISPNSFKSNFLCKSDIKMSFLIMSQRSYYCYYQFSISSSKSSIS